MGCLLELLSKDECIKINLSNKEEEINVKLINKLVYQNKIYSLKVENDSEKVVEDINIYINNEEISERFRISGNRIYNNSFQFSERNFFSSIFGYAQICIEFIYNSNDEESFFSEYIEVAIDKNNSEAIDSIKEMINYIYNNNYKLLNMSNSNRVSLISTGIKQSDFKEIDTELNLLKEIIVIYNREFRYFKTNLRYKYEHEYKVDDFNKLTKIDTETIKFIVTNPQYLKPVNYKTGITYGGVRYQPVKTLISSKKVNENIYENKVVIGFLKYLLKEINKKIRKIEGMIQQNNFNTNLNEVIDENYILSSDIVNNYSRIIVRKYLEQLQNYEKLLEEIYYKYKKVINCEELEIIKLPRMSEVFRKVEHYRNIYFYIDRWFNYGNYDITQNSIVLSFLTADQVYEYYSLLNIIDVISMIGFVEVTELREEYKYKTYGKFYKNTKFTNTFYFKRNNQVLTLYYQPVIYSYNSSTRNGITLFRVDRTKNYYTPDFLIKVKDADEVKYGIIDSKWSKQNDIKKYALPKCILSYINNIKDESSLKSVDFMWLLQGRDDNCECKYSYNCGEISRARGEKFMNSSAVIKLLPSISVMTFAKLLEEFLSE